MDQANTEGKYVKDKQTCHGREFSRNFKGMGNILNYGCYYSISDKILFCLVSSFNFVKLTNGCH